MHSGEPGLSAKLPASQSLHAVELSGEVVPAAQREQFTDAGAAETVPAAQTVQAEDPVESA